MEPCWLPSAIMQTTGALLGIYIVIYVLVMQNLASLAKSTKAAIIGTTFIKLLSFLAAFLIFMCIVTIIVNAVWLDSLSANLLLTNPSEILEALALSFFYISVLLLLISSISIIFTYAIINIKRHQFISPTDEFENAVEEGYSDLFSGNIDAAEIPDLRRRVGVKLGIDKDVFEELLLELVNQGKYKIEEGSGEDGLRYKGLNFMFVKRKRKE